MAIVVPYMYCYVVNKAKKVKRSKKNDNKQKNREKVKIAKNSPFIQNLSALTGFLRPQLFLTWF